MSRKRRGSRSVGDRCPRDIEINGHVARVTVSYDGEFLAEWEGVSIRSTTYQGLRSKLLPLMRDDLKRCAVPAMYRGYGDEFAFVTLIGLHAGNDNVLYVDSAGKTHQESARSPRVYRVLTQAELAECKRLEGEVKKQEKKLKAWLKVRSIDAGNTVRKAIGLKPSSDERDLEDIN